MSKPHLKEQIERIRSAMNIYLEMSQTKDESTLKSSIIMLKNLGMWVADPPDYVPDYDPDDVTDSRVNTLVKEFIALNIFSTLFEEGKKMNRKNPDFDSQLKLSVLEVCNVDLPVQLGLSIMDVYNKKVKNIETNFFEELKFNPHYTKNRKNSFLEKVLKLKYKGRLECFCEIPDYVKVEMHYKKALDLVHEIIANSDDFELIKKCRTQEKSLEHLIAISKIEYEKWTEKHSQMKKFLKTEFPVKKDLTIKEYYNLYRKLKEFKDKICSEYNADQYENIDTYRPTISAIKKHITQFIKVLNKKEVSHELNKILSGLYVLCGTIKKETPYDKRVIPSYLKKALAYDKTSLEAYYNLVTYYKDFNNEAKALEVWSKLIGLYFKRTNEINLQRFKDSTNEVGKIVDKRLESFYFDKLIIKKSKKDISKEYNLLKIIHNSNHNKSLIPKPVAYIPHKDGYNYLITREAETMKMHQEERIVYGLNTLSEAIKYVNDLKINESGIRKLGFSKKDVLDSFKIRYLKNSLKSLIDLQGTISSLSLKKEKYDLKIIIKDKITKRLSKGNQYLTNALEFLVENIDKQKKCFNHGDYHSGNILIKHDRCIPLDFERVNFLPYLYDVAFLLEQKEFSDLNENYKKGLLKYFFDKKGTKFDFEQSEDYDYMSLFINLRWASISSRFYSSSNDETYNQDVKFYLKKTGRIIDNMVVYTSGKEYSELNNLKQCLIKSNLLE